MSKAREIKFRRTATYDDELGGRPSHGLRVEALEGKLTRPAWLKGYPQLYSFRVNKQARVIFWWRDDGTCEYLLPFAKHYTRS